MLQRKFAEAEEVWRVLPELRTRVQGAEHPDTLASIRDVGNVLTRQGRHTEAESLYRRALEVHTRALGPDHEDTRLMLENLALSLRSLGRIQEAEQHALQLLEIERRVLGDAHVITLASWTWLSELAVIQDDYARAREYTDAYIEAARQLAESPQATAADLNEIAWYLLTWEPPEFQDPRAALGLIEKAVELDGASDANILDTLAYAYQRTGHLERAVETQRRAVAALRNANLMRQTAFEAKLVEYLLDIGATGEAAKVARDMISSRRTSGDEYATAYALVLAATQFVSHGEHAEAETRLRECLEIRKRILPEGHWFIANTNSILGGAIAGQGRYQEAEPLLLESYSSLKDDHEALLARKREALKRLVELYEAWGKPDEAAMWRAKQERP